MSNPAKQAAGTAEKKQLSSRSAWERCCTKHSAVQHRGAHRERKKVIKDGSSLQCLRVGFIVRRAFECARTSAFR